MSEARKLPTSKDDYDMMKTFEKIYGKSFRMDKEDKHMWNRGIMYQHPEVNKLFLAFREGVAYGKRIGQEMSSEWKICTRQG